MLNKIKAFIKANIFVCSLIPLTFFGIIISTILNDISFFRILPLINSLVIMLLHSQANRYGFLLGGINSIIYAIVDISFTLYSSAVSALLLGFPIQILTFLRWNKRAYKKSTKFTRLSPLWRLSVIGMTVLTYLLLNLIFRALGSQYMLIDNLSFVMALLTYVLTFFSFIEYPIVQILANVVTLSVNVTVFINDPARLPFLIYSVYALCCVTRGAISVFKLYREQQKAKESV